MTCQCEKPVIHDVTGQRLSLLEAIYSTASLLEIVDPLNRKILWGEGSHVPVGLIEAYNNARQELHVALKAVKQFYKQSNLEVAQ